MKLRTRLLLSLLPAAAVIMALYGYWALEQREATLVREAQGEIRAYAAAVGLAFEHALGDFQFRDVQAILDEVGRQPKVHAVLVYDTLGVPRIASEGAGAGDAAPAARIREVARRAEARDSERSLAGGRVFSVLRPIRDREGRVTGVLEVMQPLEFVGAERVRTAQRFLLNTLTLLAVLGALTVWLLRRFVDRPIRRFMGALRRVGRGDLSERVEESQSVSELAEVAREFNRMAEGLESAREALLRETEERLVLEQRVRERDKLAALGTLAAGVAHQIAAPLNVIEGRARLLLRRTDVAPETSRNLTAIVAQSERITRIVRSLLDFARRPEPVLGVVQLDRVIRAAAARLEEDFAEGHVRLRRPEEARIRVRGDRDLLEEVVVILLGNALEAVRETDGRREVAIRVGAREAEGEAWLEVADTGPGIPSDALPRVFEAFFTTKEGGTGLGLAVARSVIEGLGGRIEARGDEGATFRLTLPLWMKEGRDPEGTDA